MDTIDRIFQLVDQQYSEQQKFASDLGIPPSRISEWRLRKSASYNKRLPQIAEILNTTVDYLLTGRKKEPTPVSGSEPIDPLTAQLMEFVRHLTPDQKKFLLAQMKTMLENQ